MSGIVIDLSDEAPEHLEKFANARRVSLSSLIEEISPGAADQFTAEADFRAMAAQSDRQRAQSPSIGMPGYRLQPFRRVARR